MKRAGKTFQSAGLYQHGSAGLQSGMALSVASAKMRIRNSSAFRLPCYGNLQQVCCDRDAAEAGKSRKEKDKGHAEMRKRWQKIMWLWERKLWKN